MTATSTTSSATKKSAKNALVPRLRFPEFEGEWELSILKRIANISMGSSPKSKNYNNASIGLPFMQGNADIKNRRSAPRIFTSEITRECFVDDILFSVRAPVGFVAKSAHHACIGRGLAAIQANVTTANEFLYQWLVYKEGSWTNISQGGTFDAIRSKDLKSFPVPLPSLPEQQKIADCLSSLDDLITAESEKLEALKVYKKGLMQELFPREGETTPRLRFPEFEGSGEWEVKQLGDIVKFQSGSTPSKANDTFWDGTIPWASAKDMKSFYLEDTLDHITEVAVKSGAKLAPTKSILMLTRGMTLLRDIPICFLTKTMSFNQDVKALHVRKDKDPAFIAFLLLSMKPVILSIVTIAGHGTGRLDTDQLKALPLCIPTLPEQQKIASVLSSLDDRITAQAEQIETLQAHKKGLMQQLFPVMEG